MSPGAAVFSGTATTGTAGGLQITLNGVAHTFRSAYELWAYLAHYAQTGALAPVPPLPALELRAAYKKHQAELRAQEAWIAANPGAARRAPPSTPSMAERLREIEEFL